MGAIAGYPTPIPLDEGFLREQRPVGSESDCPTRRMNSGRFDAPHGVQGSSALQPASRSRNQLRALATQQRRVGRFGWRPRTWRLPHQPCSRIKLRPPARSSVAATSSHRPRNRPSRTRPFFLIRVTDGRTLEAPALGPSVGRPRWGSGMTIADRSPAVDRIRPPQFVSAIWSSAWPRV